MEQIYYTQCPVGYGLGASNGFQVKRLSRGYPTSGDFRHLGLKAFPGGGRTLAPPTLRYRRDGEIAEVACLTPRAHEYETERGLWGRPGGLFSHGLRLEASELNAIRHWPAGLLESPIWQRSDREPSRGREPEPIELSAASLPKPPSFAEVAPLADGIDPETLGRLLTALARSAEEGRTLFLIDEPSRLGPRIALLTFAFPEPFRSELTFSTYHDRPEELPGYRLQGTIPLARPNRPALLAQGSVADLTLGTFEPPVEAAPWAQTLAGWLTRREPIDEADWSATEVRARVAGRPGTKPSIWNEAGLTHLFGFPGAYRARSAPDHPAGWQVLQGFAEWSGSTHLGQEWLRPRGPGWWRDCAPCRTIPEARSALVAHACLPDAWSAEGQPAEWGQTLAEWLGEAGPEELEESIARAFRSAPPTARPSFARALLRGLSAEAADGVLQRLRDDYPRDRASILPMETTALVSAILGGADPGGLAAIIDEARSFPGAIPAVLDAVEAGLADHPEVLPGVVRHLAGAFDLESREGLIWAFRRGKLASGWLAPMLRPLLADLGRQADWFLLRDRTPDPFRSSMARAVLDVALDPGLPDEAYRWAIENLLLPLAPRPHHPAWAEAYLRRTPSGLDLLRRFSSAEYKKLGVLAWLKQARGLGEISDEQSSRIDSCLDYARALASRDPRAIRNIHVPSVPPEERGPMLGQMLSHVSGAQLEGLPFVLGACRESWPGAFEPGAPGLRALAVPLARCLSTLRLPPGAWFGHLGQILGRLGLDGPGTRGFEPDGLAAEVVAAASKIPDLPTTPWPLRQFLLREDRAWKILTADIRRDLAEVTAPEAPEVLARWDQKLEKPRPERFWELFLNAAGGRRLALCVANRSMDLKSLPPLPWWDHAGHDASRDDLRDGFARLSTMAPLPEGRLFQVRAWVESPTRRPEDVDEADPPGLSAIGWDRWKCLEELTNYRNAGQDATVRWPILEGWKEKLPIASLSLDDRHRFVAWIVEGLDEAESYQIARLAGWLIKVGIKDHARVARWSEEIEDLAEIPDRTRISRLKIVGDLKSEIYVQLRDRKESKAGPTGKSGSPRG